MTPVVTVLLSLISFVLADVRPPIWFLPGLDLGLGMGLALGKKTTNTNTLPRFLSSLHRPATKYSAASDRQVVVPSLTFPRVSRSVVDLLRDRLNRAPPASSPLLVASSMSPCSFLTGSPSGLVGSCTVSGACRVRLTDYLGLCGNQGESSPCLVTQPPSLARGGCSKGGHCRAGGEVRWNHLQCVMGSLGSI